jgi:hypothetical protein
MGSQGSSGGITLEDVVIHMQHMEQRLTTELREVKSDIVGMKGDITGIKGELRSIRTDMHAMEERLMTHIDEDLTATMRDVYEIQLHLGLRTAEN